ncbi:MAG TPA: hypothetical protein VLF89_07545 [Candidatus Saccharimonadales bacterium]|nr:hypothetical protein [Candidatus Saccharimonadales bacterium]
MERQQYNKTESEIITLNQLQIRNNLANYLNNNRSAANKLLRVYKTSIQLAMALEQDPQADEHTIPLFKNITRSIYGDPYTDAGNRYATRDVREQKMQRLQTFLRSFREDLASTSSTGDGVDGEALFAGVTQILYPEIQGDHMKAVINFVVDYYDQVEGIFEAPPGSLR